MKYYIIFFFFFIHSAYSQQREAVDFKTLDVALNINPVQQNVVGHTKYTFDVLKPIDTIRIDAQRMSFTEVKINGKSVQHKNNNKALLLYEGYQVGTNEITFSYEAIPQQTMYFVNWNFTDVIDTPVEVQGQIWTQGQGKYTSHWLPSFDDPNEKVIFNLNITFEKSFTVISNGLLQNKTEKGEEISWQFRMNYPMSSYLVMLAIGHFDKYTESSSSGVPLEYYYEKEDLNKIEPTYRYSKQIFDFLEREIGYAYPWKIYKQVPVRDFLYAGMENTTATVFSKDFVVDTIGRNDKTYTNVNAHELAHQWFGDLITAKTNQHHWLQEGFATYYALLAEKDIYGEDYFNFELYKNAQLLLQASKTDTIPLLNEKASSLTFYQKGAWALHSLREAIGAKTFNLAVKNYLEKYAFKNVTTDDFLAEINKVSRFDTANFRKKWLEQTGFPEAEALDILKKNSFIKHYLEVQAMEKIPFAKKSKKLESLLTGSSYFPIKELIVYQLTAESYENKEKLLTLALKTNDVHVRQAVAVSLNPIPEKFRSSYETLLDDPSYITKEIALFNLWQAFPKERVHYIETAKKWEQYQNKNLELLYLTLSIMTPEFKEQRKDNYKKLLEYTGTNYDTGIRQIALDKLLTMKLITDDVLKSLVYGTVSHRWQFTKFSRETIRSLLKDKSIRERLEKIQLELPLRQKNQLDRLLEE